MSFGKLNFNFRLSEVHQLLMVNKSPINFNWSSLHLCLCNSLLLLLNKVEFCQETMAGDSFEGAERMRKS